MAETTTGEAPVADPTSETMTDPVAPGDPVGVRDLRVGIDGRARCGWGAGDPLYVPYHDHEWGRPLRDERALFELLCLEAFQSGLSWLTILRKRDGFRAAFDGFDVDRVAAYGPADVARLLGDAGIVRNRAKVDATIANARAVTALHDAGESLVDAVWAHAPARTWQGGPRFRSLADIPSATPESTALARDLRRRGFRFVGPVVAYALMQSAGVVDDHLDGCWVVDC
jgi:DNA-3-methyladenine glycosylase I